MEQTFVMVKPDGVQRGLVGEIMLRLERRGLKLIAAKFMQVSRDLAEMHYAVHKGKPFYEGLSDLYNLCPRDGDGLGRSQRRAGRQADHGCHPAYEAAPGTVRHDFGLKSVET